VSTDRGVIYCFGSNAPASPKFIQPNVVYRPYGENTQNAERAKVILQRSGVREGYALDMGCGDGALAHELARQSDLFVYAIDSDPNMVELAREKLDAAGVYGVSVAVHVENPFAMHYPDYFADLVVSSRSMREGGDSVSLGEAKRVQRPCGGVVMIGNPATCEISIRGLLPGSGEWTHQYTNPANTLCSSDARVGGPLHMLWYKDNTLRMAQRHGRPPAPLFHEGRIFSEGKDALRAVDAYNGRVLWEYPLPGVLRQYDQDHLMGTAGTGSNFCAADGRIYLHTQDRVLCLDAATGKAAHEYGVPTQPNGEPGTWGYIACADGILFGSVADTRHVVKWRYIKGRMDKQYTESHSFFAMDAQTGEVIWRYDAKDSIRHNTICIGEDVVYLIDRPQAEFDRINYAKRRGEESTHPLGMLVALNKQTGKELWRNEKNIYGTMLALSETYGMLLMTYQPTRFRLRSEIGGRMAAFHAHSGKRIWDIEADYASRPLINGKTAYAQPGAWDLLTGAKRDFTFERSYGCGTLAASKNMLVFRSGTLSYRDLRHDREVQNYGGIRSGCWIDILPAGGLVLLPNSANGCVCSYLNLASIALQPVD
ncbi:PQQ-binding-like beta-propeller repeat protein, partial [bacterium]|nr:PQQ-binding-like beta-propeller repeat protein [bacterium]